MNVKFLSPPALDSSRPASILRDLADGLLAVVFPTSCVLCDRELAEASWSGVCGTCWSNLDRWSGAACARCGLPIASEQPFESHGGVAASAPPHILCSQCRTEEYEFDLARSYGLYGGKLRAAILQLKFHHYDRLGRRLGELLVLLWSSVEENAADAEEAPLIVPVPLHSSRRRERGFNQAELLARGLARALTHREIPAHRAAPRVEARGLRRARATAPQTGLSLSVRQSNVRGAFVVESPQRFRDRRVVLVDDVMTTGATASACAAALKRAGARQVMVLTLARVTPQFPDLDLPPPDLPVDDLGQDSQ